MSNGYVRQFVKEELLPIVGSFKCEYDEIGWRTESVGCFLFELATFYPHESRRPLKYVMVAPGTITEQFYEINFQCREDVDLNRNFNWGKVWARFHTLVNDIHFYIDNPCPTIEEATIETLENPRVGYPYRKWQWNKRLSPMRMVIVKEEGCDGCVHRLERIIRGRCNKRFEMKPHTGTYVVVDSGI